IKPQFETGEKRRYKNGIIKDGKVIKNAVLNVLEAAVDSGLSPVKITPAPEKENKNREYLALLYSGDASHPDLSSFFE
ncbi:MAG: TlyA family rRNA (cytidine-2'-O)-methyltransferase, partial [Clostridia bacterium]|nr:TlyA family rRNA (cytidine-2'-O)-methyltransferase [Clostridia bacterium]